jgi:ornithine carbamoyltransferase
MSPRELAMLAEHARSLMRAADAGATQPLLRGRRFGVLCAADAVDNDDVALFNRACVELGAKVAYVRPQLTELSEPQGVKHTAHMLGRLYDALMCPGLAPVLGQRLSADAGIPVFGGLAAPHHPIAKIADMLGQSHSATDNRRFAFQALLLATIA